MSIANEIERIMDAKAKLRSAIESKGITVSDDVILDDYPELFEKCPSAIRGTFTPEEDTKIFTLNNLSFSPQCWALGCVELHNTAIPKSFIQGFHQKGVMGFIRSRTSDMSQYVATPINPGSSATNWGSTEFVFAIPDSKDFFFKAGYTYEYMVCGGVSQ